MMDRHLARLDALGATHRLTADHGMNAKHGADGRPNVIYLQDAIDAWIGKDRARVILPITDPTSCITARSARSRSSICRDAEAAATRGRAHRRASRHRIGTDARRSRRALRAAVRPHRRPGGGVAARHGHRHRRDRHDLSGLDVPLRSHGGTSEQKVPLLVNCRVGPQPEARRWRNFDAFDLGLNLAARAA